MIVDDGKLRISGWAWSSRDRVTPRRIWLEVDGAVFSNPLVRRLLPSPALAEAFGSDAAHAGFEAIFSTLSPGLLDTIARASFIFEFDDVRRESVPVLPQRTRDAIARAGGLAALRIGVGVTTWNRQDLIAQTVESLRTAAIFPTEIFVSDDGSTDQTTDVLRATGGISWLSARNRGIAWNKNRALYYLHRIRHCDIVILLEDDVRPTKVGWDIEWILATLSNGHINYAPEWFLKDDAHGDWHAPIHSGMVSGQCSGFTSEALDYVGYLDSRFRRYGHEHVEHTMRMIRAGYGGICLREGTRDCTFFLINGGLRVMDAQSSGNSASVAENGLIFDAIWDQGIHRMAWRTDDEMRALRDEFANVVRNASLEGKSFRD